MNITIKVDEECIAEGVRESAHSCAVALAIKQQVPGVNEHSVSVCDFLKFSVGNDKYSIHLPKDVRIFIEDFDFGRDPAPIEFVIDLVSE